jgi:hypothetical protein
MALAPEVSNTLTTAVDESTTADRFGNGAVQVR